MPLPSFATPPPQAIQVPPSFLPVQEPRTLSSSSCLRSTVVGLLPDDDDMTEVLDAVALLLDALWVLKVQIWPLPMTLKDRIR
jgi:hypothetical protein